MTKWWSETGAHWGWAACLIAVVVLLAFWAAVFAALTALFGTSRTHPRHNALAPARDHAARPVEIIIPVEPAAAVLPRRP
jgi:heme/copper-type cytochrome/quinol oxidase subunit 2